MWPLLAAIVILIALIVVMKKWGKGEVQPPETGVCDEEIEKELEQYIEEEPEE